MNKQTALILAAAGCLTGALGTSAFAQSGDKTDKMSDAKMSSGKMSGKKMTHQQMMDKMNSMSVDDKAMMFDKMSENDRMASMKMAGHDMGKMSSSERMDMMGKVSSSDKATMFDKMPMDQQMSVMEKSSMMMDGKKMDKMDKMSK